MKLKIVVFLNSKEFINKIENLTGINNLEIENTLKGAEFHKITNNGFKFPY